MESTKKCSIVNCENTEVTLQPNNISFHRFPTNKKYKTKWIQATGRENWSPLDDSTICGDHFESKFFRRSAKYTNSPKLYRWAVPTVKVAMAPKAQSKPINDTVIDDRGDLSDDFVIEDDFSDLSEEEWVFINKENEFEELISEVPVKDKFPVKEELTDIKSKHDDTNQCVYVTIDASEQNDSKPDILIDTDNLQGPENEELDTEDEEDINDYVEEQIKFEDQIMKGKMMTNQILYNKQEKKRKKFLKRLETFRKSDVKDDRKCFKLQKIINHQGYTIKDVIRKP